MKLPINMNLIEKEIEIPDLLAKLTYKNEDLAIGYMRLWGEKKMTISEIHKKLTDELFKESEVI